MHADTQCHSTLGHAFTCSSLPILFAIIACSRTRVRTQSITFCVRMCAHSPATHAGACPATMCALSLAYPPRAVSPNHPTHIVCVHRPQPTCSPIPLAIVPPSSCMCNHMHACRALCLRTRAYSPCLPRRPPSAFACEHVHTRARSLRLNHCCQTVPHIHILLLVRIEAHLPPQLRRYNIDSPPKFSTANLPRAARDLNGTGEPGIDEFL